MQRARRGLIRASVLVSFFGTLSAGLLPGQEEPSDTVTLSDIRRTTASGQYAHPTSFFRLHGYVTMVYVEAQDGLGSEVGATPQILVSGLSPRTDVNESGFRNDAAVFVGGEPLRGVGAVVELHFVGNGLDPVITEAKVTWDVAGLAGGDASLRFAFGRFWWPFGIHNHEWFSAVNTFSVLSPAAGEAVPAHYNEVGAMAEGEWLVGRRVGINYVAAVGNGVPSFELMDNVMATAFDADGDRSLTGRLAVAVRSAAKVDLGFSAARGRMRSGTSTDFGIDDPRRYGAEFWALGPDLRVEAPGFRLSGYYYRSREDLEGAPLPRLDRRGATVEPAIVLTPRSKQVQRVSLVGRWGYADEETLAGQTLRRTQFGAGVEVQATDLLKAKLAYLVQREGRDAPQVANNLLALAITAEF